jgi:predicted NAD-dependent protein-ADP-ribosyltransferase YbiA (DUF1768 family)
VAELGPILEFRGPTRFLSNFWMEEPLEVNLCELLNLPPNGRATAVPVDYASATSGVFGGRLRGGSVEHIYQAAKVGPVDPVAMRAPERVERMAQLLAIEQPGDVKRAGRRVRPLIAGWDDGLKQRVMLACLRAKFAPGSQLAEELRRTGYRMLVEGNTWGDRTWGAIWMSPQGAAAGAYGIWARDGGQVLAGENWLGRLLMLVRAELDCGVRG